MRKPVIVLLHVGYWMLYLLLLTIFFGIFVAEVRGSQATIDLGEAFVTWITLMIPVAIVPGAIGFYSFYSILFNRYLTRKKILFFFTGALIAGVIAAGAGLAIFTLDGNVPINFWSEYGAVLAFLVFLTFIAIVNGVIGLVMKGFITWYGDIRLKEELARKNYETELLLIKAQLNPHFLFNTINNIDVLILKDPEKASLYLNKLSDILRFMLYETQQEEILLSQELAYIEKYIELQRIRTSNNNFVSCTITGDPGERKIASMLFIPFIENAFKYAENKKTDRAIEIDIRIEPERIVFECRNEIIVREQRAPETGGLGNELIRKRLELLYTGHHSLDIQNTNNTYLVHLEVSR
ncbi:MAG TPA: histidine kinase [Bacteroidia bacterium]|nr:histidine kinase [Bacteroidia bacterium]